MSWPIPLHHPHHAPAPQPRNPLGLGRLPVSRRQRLHFWMWAIIGALLAAGLVTFVTTAAGWPGA
ncbi:MAG: hypothetical protein J0H01_25205 [Rhizobiales bacterium]|nr:hypothetical protein [Hyphomicrobiales bacterium]